MMVAPSALRSGVTQARACQVQSGGYCKQASGAAQQCNRSVVCCEVIGMGRNVFFGLRAAGLALAAALGMASSLPAAISVTLSDPQNDTYGAGTYDIKEMTVFADDGSGNPGSSHLRFQVRFFGSTIFAPSSSHTDALFGFILIDINGDVDMASFLESFLLNPDPMTLVGGPIEYYIEIGSEQGHPGKVDLVKTSGNTTVSTPSIFFNTSFFDVFTELTIDRNDLGLSPNNHVDIGFGAIMGNANESTDVVPNIPEPASALLTGGLLVGLAGLARWRNRRQGRP
jgi:hypothetical protein